jgi:hypothetical protein
MLPVTISTTKTMPAIGAQRSIRLIMTSPFTKAKWPSFLDVCEPAPLSGLGGARFEVDANDHRFCAAPGKNPGPDPWLVRDAGAARPV